MHLLTAMLSLVPWCPSDADWLAGDRATLEARRETRQRIADTCRAAGATVEACRVLDVVAVRESSGDACAVHVLGPNEYGLGPLGLSVGQHLRKWDPDAPAFVLHVPEVSAVVGLRIFRRAVGAYRARTWLDVAHVFAGDFGARGGDGKTGDGWLFCRRLAREGVDCMSSPRGQLGKRLGRAPTDDQWTFVAGLVARAWWGVE